MGQCDVCVLHVSAAKTELESAKRESTQQINLLPLDLSKDEQTVIEGFRRAAEPFGGIDVSDVCGLNRTAEDGCVILLLLSVMTPRCW
jgi:hypothetical protein